MHCRWAFTEKDYESSEVDSMSSQHASLHTAQYTAIMESISTLSGPYCKQITSTTFSVLNGYLFLQRPWYKKWKSHLINCWYTQVCKKNFEWNLIELSVNLTKIATHSASRHLENDVSNVDAGITMIQPLVGVILCIQVCIIFTSATCSFHRIVRQNNERLYFHLISYYCPTLTLNSVHITITTVTCTWTPPSSIADVIVAMTILCTISSKFPWRTFCFN